MHSPYGGCCSVRQAITPRLRQNLKSCARAATHKYAFRLDAGSAVDFRKLALPVEVRRLPGFDVIESTSSSEPTLRHGVES